MINCVIFDFDGVLADSVKEMVEAINLVGIDIDEEKLKKIGITGIIKESNLAPNQILDKLNKVKSILNSKYSEIKAFAGIKEMLRHLKEKFKLGVLTSNSKENVALFLENNDLLEYFDFVESEDSFTEKDKKILEIVESHQLRNDEVVYVGDEVRDVYACKKAGIKIFGATWGYDTKEVIERVAPDFLVNKPEEIVTLLSK